MLHKTLRDCKIPNLPLVLLEDTRSIFFFFDVEFKIGMKCFLHFVEYLITEKKTTGKLKKPEKV